MKTNLKQRTLSLQNIVRSLACLLCLLPVCYVNAQSLVPGERLVWLGTSAPSDQETLALHDALRQAVTGRWPESLVSLEQFITNYPSSAYLPSVESQLGKVYLDSGRDTLALQHWEAAWAATKDIQGGPGNM